jgi:prepilin-type N-terminal cleavage/methylation domain-containing protein
MRCSGRFDRNVNSHGFTLVELLVVISIIALLLSILMPCLGRARDQAIRIVCASNQKQTGLALNLYTRDNGNFYPYDYLPIGADKRNIDGKKTTWQQHLISYTKTAKALTCANYEKSWTEVVARRYPNTTLTSNLNWIDWFTPAQVASFGYNHRALGCEGWAAGWCCYSNNGSVKLRVKAENVFHPQKLIAFLDSGSYLAFENMWPDSYPPQEWYREGPGEADPKKYRHNKGQNVFFADFHYVWTPTKSKYFDYYPAGKNPWWDNTK